jgi:hypothetical protein
VNVYDSKPRRLFFFSSSAVRRGVCNLLVWGPPHTHTTTSNGHQISLGFRQSDWVPWFKTSVKASSKAYLILQSTKDSLRRRSLLSMHKSSCSRCGLHSGLLLVSFRFPSRILIGPPGFLHSSCIACLIQPLDGVKGPSNLATTLLRDLREDNNTTGAQVSNTQIIV